MIRGVREPMFDCTTKLKCSVYSGNWLAGIGNFHRQHKACRCFRGPEGPVTRQCYSERYLCVPHHLGWGTSSRQPWCWCFWRLKYSFIQVSRDSGHYISCFTPVLPSSFHTSSSFSSLLFCFSPLRFCRCMVHVSFSSFHNDRFKCFSLQFGWT